MTNMFEKLVENGWLTEFEAAEFSNNQKISDCMKNCTSPSQSNIFNALIKVPFDSIKVLILGKDPYPNPKDAHGLAFSSLDKSTPDSLKNIFRAIDKTYGSHLFEEGNNDLSAWAESGVLLLNTGLTFQKVDCPELDLKEKKLLQAKMQLNHMRVWKPFVKLIIKKILTIKNRPIVLMLWGNDAHNIVFGNIKNTDFKKYIHDRGVNIIPDTQIMVLQCSHPSPIAVNLGGDFPDIAPSQFKSCDKHLGEYKVIWTEL